MLAEAREGEGGATSRKRGPWFQQMLSSRREETLTLTRTRTRNLTLTLTLILTLTLTLILTLILTLTRTPTLTPNPSPSPNQEGERRDGADGHAEGGAPETTGGDDGGEAAHVPSMERHCSTLDEYGALEQAAAFTETCAPDRF